MRIIRSIVQMCKISHGLRQKGKTIGFVPTMGALHAGHLSLIRRARKENDFTVVSIFVNPAQFGQREDLKKYPRRLKQDAAACRREGVDIIFYPGASQMYPDNYKTYVNVEGLSDFLCGRSRPGHFRGVATIVTKLFNIVLPDVAYFGQKDAQQCIIVKRLVDDFNLPVKIKVMPTVRGRDGLALSSRNAYLGSKERQEAICLYEALNKAKALIKDGEKDARAIINAMRNIIRAKASAKIDYISIVDLGNLRPVEKISKDCLIALAVWIGRTRLIDNIIVKSKIKYQK